MGKYCTCNSTSPGTTSSQIQPNIHIAAKVSSLQSSTFQSGMLNLQSPLQLLPRLTPFQPMCNTQPRMWIHVDGCSSFDLLQLFLFTVTFILTSNKPRNGRYPSIYPTETLWGYDTSCSPTLPKAAWLKLKLHTTQEMLQKIQANSMANIERRIETYNDVFQRWLRSWSYYTMLIYLNMSALWHRFNYLA